MARPLKHIEKFMAKGRLYYYYKRDGKRHGRLPGAYGSHEFMVEHARINQMFEVGDSTKKPGSVDAVICEYQGSADYKNLSPKSKLDYSHHLKHIGLMWGPRKITAIIRQVILVHRDSLVDKPATANYRIAVIRKLMSFAVDRGYLSFNPAVNPRRMAIGTWEPWAQHQIELMKKTPDVGLKTALYIALYTGQRQADILAMTWQRKRENRIDVKQQKTGKYLSIPIHTALQAYLASENIKKTSVTMVTRKDGSPYKKDHFSHAWKAESSRLKISGVVFHGLRKNATINLIEAGCTPHQVASITGMSLKMVEHYSAGVNQSKLADAAMAKLEEYQK